MTRFMLRMSMMVLAPLAIVTSGPAHCQAASATAGEERLPHISVTTMGNKGSPVVLIPGLASPRAVWDGIAPKLAADHRVYLVQVNGFAGDDPGENLSPGLIDGVVADIDSYVARHKLVGAAAIGHSMGGLIGLKLAKAHPGDLARLMIVDSIPYFGVLMAPPGMAVTVAMVEPQAKLMRDKIAASYGKPADPAAIDAQTRGLALKPESIAKMKGWAAAADPRVTANGLYDDLTTDLRGDIASIKTPMTVLYPWNSQGPGEAMTGAFYRAQYAAAPSASFVAIPDAAHFVMLDQPAAFEAAVTAFLAAS